MTLRVGSVMDLLDRHVLGCCDSPFLRQESIPFPIRFSARVGYRLVLDRKTVLLALCCVRGIPFSVVIVD